jgi:hypothetical protein
MSKPTVSYAKPGLGKRIVIDMPKERVEAIADRMEKLWGHRPTIIKNLPKK